MKIKIVEKYQFEGEEFRSLEGVKSHIEDQIGTKVIDEIIRVCPPERRVHVFKIMDVLTDPKVREVLLKYLNVTFERKIPYSEGSIQDTEIINILDI